VRLALAAGAAVSAVLGGVGCAAPAHPAQHAAHHASPKPAQVTIAQARRVVKAFLPKYKFELPHSYSPALARSLTTGAELQGQLFNHGKSGLSVTRLTRETYLVPRLTAYPGWFVAALAVRSSRGYAVDYIFVMVQAAASAPWKAAMAPYVYDPRWRLQRYLARVVARDAQGYAAISPGSPYLAVAPSALAAAYARYLNTRRSPPGVAFAPGFETTGFIRSDRAAARGARRYGWRFTNHHAPAGLPVYALALKPSGAVVFFATTDTAAFVATSSAAALLARPSRSEANYVPPPQLLLHRVQFGAVQTGTRFTITSAHQDLAIVPLAGFHRIYVPVNSAAFTSVARAH
jgi:hypothetical protein